MKKIIVTFILMFGLVATADALTISTSVSGSLFEDNYGYTFLISTDDNDSSVYHATLINTKYDNSIDALIDLIAFNMNPDLTLGSDFYITEVSPTWNFSQVTKGGIQFDYVGEDDTQANRLALGESLTFDFEFTASALDQLPDPLDPFSFWKTAEESLGKGIGGGQDLGQVAVSFQQLGSDGEGSDLLASNWPGATPVPEPGTMVLLGAGLFGLGWAGRRRKK